MERQGEQALIPAAPLPMKSAFPHLNAVLGIPRLAIQASLMRGITRDGMKHSAPK